VTLLGASLAAALYAYAGYYVYTDRGETKKKKKRKKKLKEKEKYEVDRRTHSAKALYPHHLTMKSERKKLNKK
jgi:hypothetical protein